MPHITDEGAPALPGIDVAARLDKLPVLQPFGDHHVRHRIDERDIAAGKKLQVMRGLDMRALHQLDAPRIDHDQLRARAQPPFQPRSEHRVRIGGIGTHHHDHIGLGDRAEGLRTG